MQVDHYHIFQNFKRSWKSNFSQNLGISKSSNHFITGRTTTVLSVKTTKGPQHSPGSDQGLKPEQGREEAGKGPCGEGLGGTVGCGGAP